MIPDLKGKILAINTFINHLHIDSTALLRGEEFCLFLFFALYKHFNKILNTLET